MQPDSAPLHSSFDAAPAEFASLARARELILRYGWNSTAYQIVNPGIEHWFSARAEAVVGYQTAARVRVVAGAPVCAFENLGAVVAEFEADARAAGAAVCYFCAESRLENLCRAAGGYSRVLLGAQPVWNPQNWRRIYDESKSLRYRINRARHKNVCVAEWSSERAHNHPALRSCLNAWLAGKNLPPLHFLVEPNTLARLRDRRIFVAERDNEVVGFLILSPVVQRAGFLFEQFVHCPQAPNGTVPLLIDTAMRALAADDCAYASLGLSPLSTRAVVASFDNPLWLRLTLAWMRRHGQRFYNFDGLDRFKTALQPERWEPVFAVANQPRPSPQILYAIASVFSANHPFRLLFGGLQRAAQAEIKHLRQRKNAPPHD